MRQNEADLADLADRCDRGFHDLRPADDGSWGCGCGQVRRLDTGRGAVGWKAPGGGGKPPDAEVSIRQAATAVEAIGGTPAWGDVADRLEGLGQQLKARLDEAAGTPEGRRQLRASRRSLRDLRSALERAGHALDEALGDPRVRRAVRDRGARRAVLRDVRQGKRLHRLDGGDISEDTG